MLKHAMIRVQPAKTPVSVLQTEDTTITNDLQLLIDILPERVQAALQVVDSNDLVDIVMDLGRLPEASFADGSIVALGQTQVTLEEIALVVKHMNYFTSDNRAGIPRTLHRISALRNRQGDIIGLTCRVGRVVQGTVDPIQDIIRTGKSVLLLGRPGVGKTSRLREIAKLLAEDKRVLIVDTSNEIAGDGDIPHPAVGRARRLQVPDRDRQKETLIEAVQNHTPEVIIVDEMGSESEALAARTIAERGVILIATAHGHSLENVIKNPMLSDLVGGIQTVTLSDEEAKRRSTQKTILERAKKPTFDICIEIRDRTTLAVYPDVAEAVDHLLRGWTLFPEIRKVDTTTGAIKVLKTNLEVIAGQLIDAQPGEYNPGPFSEHVRDEAALPPGQEEFRIFLYGISKSFVDRILEGLNLHHVRVTKNVYDANAVIALKANAKPSSKVLKLAQDYEVPVYFAKINSMPQIQRALRESLDAESGAFAEQIAHTPFEDEMTLALRETQEAVETAKSQHQSVELTPRRSYIRRLQHELVEKNQMRSMSIGDEPNRRLKILPHALD